MGECTGSEPFTGRLVEVILSKAGLNSQKKLFTYSNVQKIETTNFKVSNESSKYKTVKEYNISYSQKDIKKLFWGAEGEVIFVSDQIPEEYYKALEYEIEGVGYIGEKNPKFQNFEKIIFKSTQNIFKPSQIKKMIPDNVEYKKISTSVYKKNDIEIYKLSYGKSREYPSSEKYQAYFVKTKKGFYILSPFVSLDDPNTNYISYLHYIDSDSKKIISIDKSNKNGPQRIFLISQDGEPEVIDLDLWGDWDSC